VTGTGALVDTTSFPPLARYCLRLGDDAFVFSHRLAEWITNAPQIEEDLALGNIGLDLLGQARALLTRAGELAARAGTAALTEDDLIYWRDERLFTNVHLVEQPRGDFAVEMARLLWFSSYQLELYGALVTHPDSTVSGVAGKAVKEVTYHRDHATQWVLRLGDGTDESHRRMQTAVGVVAPYVDELFADDDLVGALAAEGAAVLPSTLREPVVAYVHTVFASATLEPVDASWHARGGRAGVHSEALGPMLATVQHLARSHPGASW
jgi:ring-1,2-phenylacetyl-CoA epoxidase subunit PaaC